MNARECLGRRHVSPASPASSAPFAPATVLALLGVLSGCASRPSGAAAAHAPCPSGAKVAPEPKPAAESPPPRDASEPTHVDAVVAVVLENINGKDAAALVARFSGPMREALPREKAQRWIEGILDAKGNLLGLKREAGKGSDQKGFYRFAAERGEWYVELYVDKDGKVLGLKFGDPPAPDPEVVKSTVPLGLPFRGQWLVFWGGDKLEVNQHVTHKSQRRAADLVVVDAGGKSHRGDGKKNADYFAYGQEILAVADGEVATVIDGVADNEPGAMNAYMAPGNMVIVRHADRLYSAYAHLQPSTIRVKLGAKVKKGTVLGLCGNSGNSSEAHLHFQLQDGPRFESSWGIEPVFGDVAVSRAGESSKPAHYTWLKGDIVGE